MVSWKLALLLVVAVFFILAQDVDARRGAGRRRNNNSNNNNNDGDGEDDAGTGVARGRRRGRGRGRHNRNRQGNAGSGTDTDTGDAGIAVGEEDPTSGGTGGRRGGRGGAGGRRGNRRGNTGGGRRRGGGAGGRRGQGGRGSRRRGGGRGGRGRPEQAARLMQGYAISNGKFAFDLYREFPTGDNFVLSPLGVHTTLAIVLLASNGQTKRQITQALNVRTALHPAFQAYNQTLTLGDTDATRMGMATGVYLHRDVTPSRRFVGKLRTFYTMPVSTFTANDPVGDVNHWAAQRTLGEIPDLLMDNTVTDTDLIKLFNVVYFKGRWMQGFDVANTQTETFTTASSESMDVETMSQTGNFRHKQSSALEASILELPYKGGKFAMYVILPDEGTTLTDVESRLSYELINETLAMLDEPQPISVKLPKFTLDTDGSMVSVLQALRVTNIFQADSAHLRKLTTHQNAFINDIKHRTRFEVYEAGDAQDDATDVTATTEFHANRPFAFLVRDVTTGVILTVGRFVNPMGDDVN